MAADLLGMHAASLPNSLTTGESVIGAFGSEASRNDGTMEREEATPASRIDIERARAGTALPRI